MEWMTRTDLVLLAVAGYIAVMSLVRLMMRRHDELVADVKRQVEDHRKREKKRPKGNAAQKRGAA